MVRSSHLSVLPLRLGSTRLTFLLTRFLFCPLCPSNPALSLTSFLLSYLPRATRLFPLPPSSPLPGNGTQRAFYNDPSILYISLHRYDKGDFYPSSTFGSIYSCGEADGYGRTVNIGWEGGGKNDADYLYAFQKIVMPICYEFAPELVHGEPFVGCVDLVALDSSRAGDGRESSILPFFFFHDSLCWVRCRRWRSLGWMQRLASRIRSHAAHADVSRERKGRRRAGGKFLLFFRLSSSLHYF